MLSQIPQLNNYGHWLKIYRTKDKQLVIMLKLKSVLYFQEGSLAA